MKLVFASNYYNHHQSALSEALLSRTEGQYRFVATGEMRQDRKDLGYGMGTDPEFVLHAHLDDRDEAERSIASADAVIVGSAPENLVSKRIRRGKLTFRYSERLKKKKLSVKDWAKRYILLNRRNPAGKPVYLLCAGAYTAADFASFGVLKNRAYQWGYFPQTITYPSAQWLMSQKGHNEILWAGRLIDWKHPEYAIALAQKLRDAGYQFTLNIVGSGELKESIRSQIAAEDLEGYVNLLGSMKPDAVRTYMERASIFLATSDRQEGWGAVINEAMNSGCAVVASHAMGSVPYLIENDTNGMIYRSGDIDAMFRQVSTLLSNEEQRRNMGCRAYETITQLWNAEVAAERLCCLTHAILSGDAHPDLYETGPCSKAAILSDDWM